MHQEDFNRPRRRGFFLIHSSLKSSTDVEHSMTNLKQLLMRKTKSKSRIWFLMLLWFVSFLFVLGCINVTYKVVILSALILRKRKRLYWHMGKYSTLAVAVNSKACVRKQKHVQFIDLSFEREQKMHRKWNNTNWR